MKIKRLLNAAGQPYGWRFYCPACETDHHVNHLWEFSGDPEKPTFRPSILVHPHKGYTDPTTGEVVFKDQPRCHSYVTGGRIEYQGDCGHGKGGQTVDLPELQ